MRVVLAYLALMVATAFWVDAAITHLAGCASEAECKALVEQVEEKK